MSLKKEQYESARLEIWQLNSEEILNNSPEIPGKTPGELEWDLEG